MSKIICDLCGTSYPETESQCPICGTAKTDTSKQPAVSEEIPAEKSKAGHFASEPAPKERAERRNAPAPQKPRNEPKEERRSNIGVIIVVVILLIAFIAVCAIIADRFINPENPNGSDPAGSSSSSSTAAPDVPCEGVTLSETQKNLVFSAANQTALLSPTITPANTTDPVTFESTDESVVLVNDKGQVTPVANGEATIVVRCGGYYAECKVVCENIGIEQTNPTNPTEPTEPPVPSVELKLNRTEFTLTGYGATWNLTSGSKYSGPEDTSLITWTSSKPAVATVENGKVTAVGNGVTYITAEYEGQSFKCKVICTGINAGQHESKYKLDKTDVSLYIGRSGWDNFRLALISKEDGAKVAVTFTSKNEEVCTVNEKGQVEAVGVGTTVVYVEYEGVMYECVVRVYNYEA